MRKPNRSRGGAVAPPRFYLDLLVMSALRSPNTNHLGTFKIEQILEKIEQCGTEQMDIVSPKGDIIKPIIKYCDNRVCNNPGCQIHREYQYKRNHRIQIQQINENIKKPKAWVFTGWVQQYPIDREFCQEKLKKLYHLLKDTKFGSVTEFSIHMEVKLREKDWYLHFHCVLGGLKDYRAIQTLWGRWVNYEYAIVPEQLESYIGKYASKTPKFKDETQRLQYLKYIYKTQTSRFSIGKIVKIPSGWYLYDQLEWEAYTTLKRLNEEQGYSPFVDQYYNRKHPPPKQKIGQMKITDY